MPMLIDRVGHSYGLLKVLSRAGYCKGKVSWLCKCQCGGEIVVAAGSLKTGNTTSCGCLSHRKGKDSPVFKHGGTDTKLYYLWGAMRRRCYDKTFRAYKWYGAKGVTVCKEWDNSFYVFRKWALDNKYKEGLTLDRKRNDRNYTPGNCRFLTKGENSGRNRGKITVASTSGVCGVYYIKRTNKWTAKITRNHGQTYLGTFKLKRDAITAVRNAK